MTPSRALLACAAAAVLLPPGAARAVTLDEAIALAVGHDPGLRRAQAGREAAHARLGQARAGRLPTVTVSAAASEASTDFGPFFSFGRQSLTPRSAQVMVRQPLYAGGAVSAAIGQARAGEAGAEAQLAAVRLRLAADVADAFEGVRVTEQSLVLQQAQVHELELVSDQADRRFQQGESPRTDVDQAQARLAEARAGLARAEGEVARAASRYRTLVGEPPAGLEPSAAGPAAPGDLEQAVAQARTSNPSLAAAAAGVRAAEAAVRRARAEGLPSVALVAEASTIRDQFLPGYRADGGSIGVQGRWSPFTGGLVSARVDEARADRRAAEAAYDQARAEVEEAVIDAWQDLRTAEAVAVAAQAQTRAADAALDSVRHEVRVGVKPVLDLLDAEREALAARVGDLRAQGARVVAAYRLKAAIGA